MEKNIHITERREADRETETELNHFSVYLKLIQHYKLAICQLKKEN